LKGIIFNLLEDFIVEGWGAAKFERIFEQCPVQAQVPYVGPGTYPDAHLLAIVDRATAELGIETSVALRGFGRFAFPRLAERFSVFVREFQHPKPFLKTVHGIIHLEVQKVYANAEPPLITFQDPAPDRLVMHYTSRRKLCALFAGLVEGTGDYFKVPLTLAQTECSLEGAESCEFSLHFPL